MLLMEGFGGEFGSREPGVEQAEVWVSMFCSR